MGELRMGGEPPYAFPQVCNLVVHVLSMVT